MYYIIDGYINASGQKMIPIRVPALSQQVISSASNHGGKFFVVLLLSSTIYIKIFNFQARG